MPNSESCFHPWEATDPELLLFHHHPTAEGLEYKCFLVKQYSLHKRLEAGKGYSSVKPEIVTASKLPRCEIVFKEQDLGHFPNCWDHLLPNLKFSSLLYSVLNS